MNEFNRPASHSEDELGQLMSALCDGTLTESTRDRLATLLHDNPSAKLACAKFLDLHARMLWRFREQANPASAESNSVPSPALSAVEGSDRPSVLPSRSTRTFNRPVVWSILAASLLFAAYFVTISWDMLGKQLAQSSRPAPQAVAEAPNDADTVATITASEDATWASLTPASTRGEGAAITKDSPLSIQSGLVELKLKLGTTLLIEGPAVWKIDGENKATLTQGKLVAKVPPQAIGFTLDTPLAQIVDLGTEFAVEANPSGKTSVEVLKGEITVAQSASGGSPPTVPRKLTAGDAVRVDSRSGVVKVPGDRTRFSRLESNSAKSGAESRKTQTVTFQQGKANLLTDGKYEGCRDAQLISWGPDNNFGKRVNFDVGNLTGPANSVLRFDLTPLAGKFAKITRARLILNQDPLVRVAAPGVVNVHLLSAANRHWVEGSGLSAPPSIKDGATWNQRKPGARWAGSAGASASGKDYDPRVLAHHDYEGRFFNKPFVFEIDGDLKFLADWANDDTTNAGFLLRNGAEKTANNRITFYSSDFPEVAARPALEIEYEPTKRGSAAQPSSEPEVKP